MASFSKRHLLLKASVGVAMFFCAFCTGASYGEVAIYSNNMDTNPGWTTQGQWAWGTPTGGGSSSYGYDPTSGYTGSSVYGYNLSGAYPNSMGSTYWLTTPAINCSGYTGVHLRFYRWLGVESSKYDHAYVAVSNNGSTWTNVWSNPAVDVKDTAWSLLDIDISAYADDQPTVYIRWGMGRTDGSVACCGWNIDDVSVLGSSQSPSVPTSPASPYPKNGQQKVMPGHARLAWNGNGNDAAITTYDVYFGTDPNDLANVAEGLSITAFDPTPGATALENETTYYWKVVARNPLGSTEGPIWSFRTTTPRPGYLMAWGDNTYGRCNVAPGSDFVAVAAGYYHNVALKFDGSLAAWGASGEGVCTVPSGNDFVAVAAGYYHSVAVKSDSSLVAWGANWYGQCDVPSGNDFVAVAGGYNHTVALRSDGSLAAWGENDFGQCNVPSGTGFVAVSAGMFHSVAVRPDGSLVAWGDNANGQCSVPSGTTFVAVAAGSCHNVALKSDGSLAAWGDNYFGECNSPSGTGFVAVAAGDYHSVAMRSDGSLVAWGRDSGDLRSVPSGTDFVAVTVGDEGHDVAISTAAPTAPVNPYPADGQQNVMPVNARLTWHSNGSSTATTAYDVYFGTDPNDLANVAEGLSITAFDPTPGATALENETTYYWKVVARNPLGQVEGPIWSFRTTRPGHLAAWGANNNGWCNSPSGNDFVAMAAGLWHSVALKSDGSLVAWGLNNNGQCNVPSGNDFVAVAAGWWHCVALKADGSLAAWGFNDNGECNVPSGTGFVAVAAGKSHTVALKSDGSLAAWGDNVAGECNVPAGHDFVAVAAGEWYSVALRSDGSLIAWGWSGPDLCLSTVPSGHDFVSLAAGFDHNVALKSDGSLVAWGKNDFGQCNVPSGNDFVAVAAGVAHSIALRSDGSLVAWGDNAYGQCTVSSGTDFVSLAAGGYYSAAIVSEPVLPVKLTGTISLGGYIAERVPGTQVQIECRDPNSTTIRTTETVTLGQNGAYSVTTSLAPGRYDLSIKKIPWIKCVQPAVDLVAGDNTVDFTLAGGDLNGDDSVNFSDYLVFAIDFGTTAANSDLNGDGQVNLSDYLIFASNFGAGGVSAEEIAKFKAASAWMMAQAQNQESPATGEEVHETYELAESTPCGSMGLLIVLAVVGLGAMIRSQE